MFRHLWQGLTPTVLESSSSIGVPDLMALSLSINNSVHNNNITYRDKTSGRTGLGADYGWADLSVNGANVFDYNTYHSPDLTSTRWSWGVDYDWPGFQQKKQEAHGSLDTILPPTR